MKTYQDFLLIPDSERDRAEFVRSVINDYQSGSTYRMAKIADDYDRKLNTTITQYQKYITDLYGRQYLDETATVHRSASAFFNIFLTQLGQYLLGNGVIWKSPATGKKLGDDFDTQLQRIARYAMSGGVSYGFFNFDHVEIFSALEFAPLLDEENGTLMAGVRFWQVDSSKPLRATFYTLDGYEDFMWIKDTKYKPGDEWTALDENIYLKPRTAYTSIVVHSEIDGTVIFNGENYPAFPIVPMWGNIHHQSELVGLREKIDAYDMIANGYEDDLDNAQIYWIIKGAGGMDDVDLMQFLDRLKTVKAAAPADGQDVVPVEVNIPYEARERLLDRLEKQLYKDAMIMNPEEIAGGAATATQIKAAYEPQNNKADQLEYCVVDFIDRLLEVAGLEDEPTFTRSVIVNTQEEITTIVAAAQFLDDEYVTRKILNLLGDGDQADAILRARDASQMERFGNMEEVEAE